ncbi:MAG: hypothetical protein JKY01_11225 [Pseudomonadales bacterium]|nr:hypothetical protein [Pseudomonadales bacterium]
MKALQLFVLTTVIFLGGCAAFFQQVSGLEEIQKVAIVSVLVGPSPHNGKQQSTPTTPRGFIFDQQALLEYAYVQLQNQIQTQLQWDATTDIRNHKANILVKAPSKGYEGLAGASLIPNPSLLAIASGKPPSVSTQGFIKKLCLQLNVDAVVMMSIETGQRKKGIFDKLKKSKLTPTIRLNFAAVNSRGQVILNTENFNENIAGNPIRENRPDNVQVLDAYKVATYNALDSYFYRSAMIFKRMGYPLSKIRGITQAEHSKQAVKKTETIGDSSLTSPRKTQKANKPDKPSIVSEGINSSANNDQKTKPAIQKRRSLWSLPMELIK